MNHTSITIQSHSWLQAKSSEDYSKIYNDKSNSITTPGPFSYPASTQSPPKFFNWIGCSTVRKPLRSTVHTGRRGRQTIKSTIRTRLSVLPRLSWSENKVRKTWTDLGGSSLGAVRCVGTVTSNAVDQWKLIRFYTSNFTHVWRLSSNWRPQHLQAIATYDLWALTGVILPLVFPSMNVTGDCSWNTFRRSTDLYLVDTESWPSQ